MALSVFLKRIMRVFCGLLKGNLKTRDEHRRNGLYKDNGMSTRRMKKSYRV